MVIEVSRRYRCWEHLRGKIALLGDITKVIRVGAKRYNKL